MKIIIAIALAGFVLSACTAEQKALELALRQQDATAADAKLEHDIWNQCQAESIGANRRKFGRDAAAAQNYADLCNGVDASSATKTAIGQ